MTTISELHMEKSSTIKFYSEVKTVRLKNHPRNFSSEDMIVNVDWFSKEKFQLFTGTVIEIFPIEEKKSKDRRNHLLLEVKSLSMDLQSKGGPISLSQEVAAAFNLTSGREACIRRVDKELVALDLAEFRFKDQVFSRSDMWRFTNSMIGKGMYVSRKVEFAGMLLRVSDLWAQGSRVKSGVVVDASRIVFRSASSQMFVFLQISSEMWEFDSNGDMYIDKAVDGFLSDLFDNWKEKDCNHEVSLILFSRKYYASKDYASNKSSVIVDKRKQCYEDFYKMIVNKETHSNWTPSIVKIKKGIKEFQSTLKIEEDSHREFNEGDEAGKREWISTSQDGNILEAINLAINELENHYKEVSFTTTGQQIVIVSPGVGVYEVDHQMNLMTRERIIDNGIGADLVCLNDQPLHSVPLFKFHPSDTNDDERYHIPHWINYSYYNPPRPWNKTQFRPRIVISDIMVNKHLKNRVIDAKNSTKSCLQFPPKVSPFPDTLLTPTVDYDEYDSKIFCDRTNMTSDIARTGVPMRRIMSDNYRREEMNDSTTPDVFVDSDSPKLDTRSSSDLYGYTIDQKSRRSSESGSPIKSSSFHTPVIQPRVRHSSENYDADPVSSTGVINRFKSGSAENIRHQTKPQKKKKTFINPFDPKKSHIEDISSHNCRWIHTFPRDKEGKPFQRHHDKASLKRVDEDQEMKDFSGSTASSSTATTAVSSPSGERVSPSMGLKSHSSHSLSSIQTISPVTNRKMLGQNFSSVKREGTDWTSFSEPACLPLTTDFYPEQYVLQRDYTDYPTNLTVNAYGEDVSEVTLGWRSDHMNMNTVQAFKEMISQRLLQGFQLVFDSGYSIFTLHKDLTELEGHLSGKRKKKHKEKEIIVKFSLGRVFQRIDLTQLTMLAHTFRTKSPLSVDPVPYKYSLAVDKDTIVHINTSLTQVSMEGFNWNYLDQHVCGHQDFDNYQESNKFWRCRYLLLPMTPPPYDKCADDRRRWINEMTNDFIKFAEYINHLKRVPLEANHKPELKRYNSVPASPYHHHGNPTSRSPSPSPLPKRHSDRETYTKRASNYVPPLRNLTEPSSSPSSRPPSTREDLRRKAKSREDLSASMEDDHTHHPPVRSTPLHSMQLRSKEDVLSDLKHLTVSPAPMGRPYSPSQASGRSSLHTASPSLSRPLFDEDGHSTGGPGGGRYPPLSLNLVPSLIEPSSSSSGLESSLDFNSPDHEDHFAGELTINSPLEQIVKDLFDKNVGVDTLKLDKSVASTNKCCFGLEAVNWLLDHMENISRKEAVRLLEKAVNENLISHISCEKRIPFIDGCYMYCKTKRDTSMTYNEEWESYKKKWFEVAIVHLEDILPSSSLTEGYSYSESSSLTSSYLGSMNNSPYYMRPREKSGSTMSDIYNRYLEINPDIRKVSDRPEWCYLQYENMYNPLRVYEIEFQWMVATASILNEMIQSLVHRASMCSFSLVPVLPLSALKPNLNEGTGSGTGNQSHHPFYYPLKIPLTVSEDIPKNNVCNVVTNHFRMIIERFGFLLDPSSITDSSINLSEVAAMFADSNTTNTNECASILPINKLYVHYTGCALIEPWFDSVYEGSRGGACGFYWYKNSYYLSQKPAVQSGAGTKYDELFRQFTEYCRTLIISDSNSDGLNY